MSETQIILDRANVSTGGTHILKNVSLLIRRGECIRIAGKSGSGKTTLLRLIKGEINPDGGIGSSRIYLFNGENSPSPIHAAPYIRLVSPAQQDCYRQKGWNLSGLEVVATGIDDSPLLYRMLSPSEETNISELFEWMGIEFLKNKSILHMSRGEGRKILIARAIISRPQILLLDEFMHELDPLSRKDVSLIVEKIHNENITVLYTSHRNNETLLSTERTVFLEQGEIKELSSIADITQSKTIIDYNVKTDKVAEELISVRNCSVYLNNSLILKDINFQMDSLQNWAIVGANGSGKSTFIKMLYGLILPSVSSDIKRYKIEKGDPLTIFHQHTGLISSELQALYDHDVVCSRVVASGFRSSIDIYDELTEDEIAASERMLSEMGLLSFAEREFGSLSYGEQRKILFARALVHQPKILFLDEPFTGVDSDSREWLLECLHKVSAGRSRIIIAVHHIEDIPETITHLLHFEKGRVCYSGLFKEFPVEAYMSGV